MRVTPSDGSPDGNDPELTLEVLPGVPWSEKEARPGRTGGHRDDVGCNTGPAASRVLSADGTERGTAKHLPWLYEPPSGR